MTRALPVIALTLIIGLGVVALLLWSGHKTDGVSHERQARLVKLVVDQLRTSVAHDQESVTVWDDAVQEVRANNATWINSNLGSWMHDYFGFDGAYVLDPENRPTYAFANGKMAAPIAFDAVSEEVLPLVQALREKLRAGDMSQVSETVLSPGVADLAVVRQHPAIITVKPIVSDTGDIAQTAGEEYVHVLVRFLDGSLIGAMQSDYMFENLTFSWKPSEDSSVSNQPLKSADGRTIGYFVWRPYSPGSAVMAQVVPVLLAVLVLALAAVATFLVLHFGRAKRLEASEERIRHMALHDSLTGLPNRMHFNDQVDRILSAGVSRPIALLYLDLDRFKQVNDTLGHPAGDALIRDFGKRLAAIVRKDDIIARIGGDEFTIMMSSVASVPEIERLCQRMIDEARRPFDIDGNKVFVGVSIGVAFFPHDGADRTNLLRKADVALYYSKTTGRGRYSFFSEEMDRTLALRQKTEADLRAALNDRDQLSVHYQPILSAVSQQIVGYEALLRWQHPQNGAISPELFIPIAEETGLIEILGERVLLEACTAAAEWRETTISVNVSGVELCNPHYARKVENVLLSVGLAPQRLELEITETAATDETSAASDNLRALRELGVQISIDDFGTGFSSLARLQSLKVHRIKIDRSFVHGLGQNDNDKAIIRAIVDLAHAKGLKTTAEGVETAEQETSLIRIGCDNLQGYLYSVAVPIDEIKRRLAAGQEGRNSNSSHTIASSGTGDGT